MDRLGGEEIATTDLIGDLEQAVAAGRLFPVLAGAAIGHRRGKLLEVAAAFPSPTERPRSRAAAPTSGRRPPTCSRPSPTPMSGA